MGLDRASKLRVVGSPGRQVVEPNVVVANREDLWWLLAEASALEHMLMCQYLFAEFTLKQGETDGLSHEQAEAVERWRTVLRGIAVEEMLHLALVANLMASIGAAPTFARPNFPQRSNYFPASVQLDLLPFGEPALKHFLYLERPEGMELQDAEGFVPSAPPLQPLTEQDMMPRGQEFLTVGHLYRGIEAGLALLTDKLGERAVFVGSPRAQATPELLGGWQQLIPVTGLESALAAINEIIEQGEGARGDWRDAHYGRFLAIWDEYHAMLEADPSFQPARPVIAAYTRQPFDIAADVPIIGDPVTYRVAELATVAYELVLQLLTRFFTHTDETDAQLEVLIGSAIELMSSVIRPLGTALTKLPIGPPHDRRTAGFAFEMYYLMGNFVPWREPAWALLHERTATLVEKCNASSKDEREPGVLADAGRRMDSIASKLSAHVPHELLGAQVQ